eukprot:gene1319-541_t
MPTQTTTSVNFEERGYRQIKFLAKGQYGSAFLLNRIENGEELVAKTIDLNSLNKHDRELAHQEAELLKNLKHDNIVSHQDGWLDAKLHTLVICMEFCRGGDLRRFIKDRAKQKTPKPLSQNIVLSYFSQLALALNYIHGAKLLHRGLKSSNVFVYRPEIESENNIVKLGDFGISRVLEGSVAAAHTVVGTPYYMSPEVCQNLPYSFKSDVWALGCICYEMCMLKHAFESGSLLGLVYRIISGDFDPIREDVYSQDLSKLVTRLLTRDATKRPSTAEILQLDVVVRTCPKHSNICPSTPLLLAQPKPPTLKSGVITKAKTSPIVPEHELFKPFDDEGDLSFEIPMSRIRLHVIGKKINWVTKFGNFDVEKKGFLTVSEFRDAMSSLHFGLSRAEMDLLAGRLTAQDPLKKDRILNVIFSKAFCRVSLPVVRKEKWTVQTLGNYSGQLADAWREADRAGLEFIDESHFRKTLRETVQNIQPQHEDILVMLAPKNLRGEIAYKAFMDYLGTAFNNNKRKSEPGVRRSPMPPPGLPPLPGNMPLPLPPPPKAPPTGYAVPPLPTSPGPGLRQTEMSFLGATCQTFFTAQSSEMSEQYFRLCCGRIKKRLDKFSAPTDSVFKLFISDFTRPDTVLIDDLLTMVSSLAIGISRSEMQQIFWVMDEHDDKKVSISKIIECIDIDCIDSLTAEEDLIKIMLCFDGSKPYQCIERLRERANEFGFVRECDFRLGIMQVYDYLTREQLERICDICDKDADGHIDFYSFFLTFDENSIKTDANTAWGTVPQELHRGRPNEVELGVNDKEYASILARICARLAEINSREKIDWILRFFDRQNGCEMLPSAIISLAIGNLQLNISQREADRIVGCWRRNYGDNTDFLPIGMIQNIVAQFPNKKRDLVERCDLGMFDLFQNRHVQRSKFKAKANQTVPVQVFSDILTHEFNFDLNELTSAIGWAETS